MENIIHDLMHMVSGSSSLSQRALLRSRLRAAGMRPTRQRMSLAEILLGRGPRHLSAEDLQEEAGAAGIRVSLATIYNTLNQFSAAGLLREVVVDGSRTYFDTNLEDHHHFFIEEENTVIDIPSSSLTLSALPEAPEGMEITHVDVVIRLRRKRG